MSIIYEKALEFKRKYPFTIAWRIKAHSKSIEKHLNTGEDVLYVFAAQKSNSPLDIFSTYMVALTNKRILLASKRLVFGYFFKAITPDMFNDLTVRGGLFWGQVCIDTIKEVIELSNIQKDALPEIETNITEYMMREKRKFKAHQDDHQKELDN